MSARNARCPGGSGKKYKKCWSVGAKGLKVVVAFAVEYLMIACGKHGHSTSKSDIPMFVNWQKIRQ